jgi:hypothetical protein
MNTQHAHKPRLGKLPVAWRKAVATTQEEQIKTSSVLGGENFTLLIQPAFEGVDLLAWSKEQSGVYRNPPAEARSTEVHSY